MKKQFAVYYVSPRNENAWSLEMGPFDTEAEANEARASRMADAKRDGVAYENTELRVHEYQPEEAE